jgi:hypothetical protein
MTSSSTPQATVRYQLRRALTPSGTLVIVGIEVRGRLLGGFDRNLRAVALSRLVGQRLRCWPHIRGSRTSGSCGSSSRPARSPLSSTKPFP